WRSCAPPDAGWSRFPHGTYPWPLCSGVPHQSTPSAIPQRRPLSPRAAKVQGLAPAQGSVKTTAGFTYNQVPPVRQSDSSRRAAILARTRSDNANPLKFRDLAVRHPKHLCKNLPVVLAQHWRGNIGAERVVRDARDGARIKMPPDDSAIDRNEI